MATREYWLSLNPELTISEYPFLPKPLELNMQSASSLRYVEQMRKEGHYILDSVLPTDVLEKMSNAVIKLKELGYPPAFVYVYDEFWHIFKSLAAIAEPVLGKNYRLATNMWVWCVEPGSENAGFAPHRDVPGGPNLHTDGLPRVSTVWIALKDVDTLNSCIYVLPTNADPNLPDRFDKVSIPFDKLQDVRALPAKAGSVLSWNANAIHWGSKSSEWTDHPRISMAAYLIREDARDFTSISLHDRNKITLDFRLGIIGVVMSYFEKSDIDKNSYLNELRDFCNFYYHCETDERRPYVPGKKNPAAIAKTEVKVGRNDPCPCGSGKKFKRCCGAI